MPGCPSCGRPVALARPSCLYCGAPLAAEPAFTPPAAPAQAPPAAARTLVVLDLDRVGLEALAAAGIGGYEAGMLLRRGGLHLHRALEPAAAAELAARLRSLGLTAFEVPEAEARQPPLRVTSGERRPGRLLLRGGEGTRVELCAAELLLLVAGEIARERPARPGWRALPGARLPEGRLVHLHRVGDPRPVELDAVNFTPGVSLTGSARLEIEAWIAELAPGLERDERFRLLPPALAPAEPEPPGPLAAASSLRAAGARTAARLPGQAEGAPDALDNSAQFRFYSGWRAAVERRRRGSSPAPPPC